MLDRLSSVEERYEELNRLLSDPVVVADYTKVQQYAKEQAAMREVVELARNFRKLQKEISEQIKIMFEYKYTILHYNSGAYTITKLLEKKCFNFLLLSFHL